MGPRTRGPVPVVRGWALEPRGLADFGSGPVPAPDAPLIVTLRPDPWERRQVASWFLAAFEVTLAVVAASFLGSLVAGLAGAALASALSTDVFGTVIPALLRWALGGLIGGYLMLRLLADLRLNEAARRPECLAPTPGRWAAGHALDRSPS